MGTENILSIFLSLFGVTIAALAYADRRREGRRWKSINLEQRLTALETKMELFWGPLQSKMAELLHSPHTPELDELLDRLNSGSLDIKGLHELRDLLDETTNSRDATPLTKVLAVSVLGRVRWILYGKENKLEGA